MHQPQSPSARLRWAAGTLALLAAAVVIGSLWQRNASPAGPTAPLTSPLKFVADRDESGLATQTKTNDVITYTLVVYGNGISTETMALTDTVGSNGTIAPASASASSGTANISGNTLTLDMKVLLDYPASYTPMVQRYRAVQNIKMSRLKIARVNQPTLEATYNYGFFYAYNCLITQVESSFSGRDHFKFQNMDIFKEN